MKKFLASLLNPQAEPQKDNIPLVDPKKILFTTPTLSNDLPPLEALASKPGSSDFGFHEDEWCQVEFFPRTRLGEIQQTLKEYKQFEQSHRARGGWDHVFIRDIERLPVISARDPLARLEKVLGGRAGEAPILFTSGANSSRVSNGFTIPLGGNVTLYGYVEGQDIPALGAHVGRNADDSRLTDAFMKLSASSDLLLVDWRAELMIVEAGEGDRVKTWRP